MEKNEKNKNFLMETGKIKIRKILGEWLKDVFQIIRKLWQKKIKKKKICIKSRFTISDDKRSLESHLDRFLKSKADINYEN